MLITLQRGQTIGISIMGELFIGGYHAGWSLERKGVEIPAGTYPITLYDSPHFGREMPLLEDVPGRSEILIHWGNYPQNSDGCILVGEIRDMASGEIFNTRKKFDELFLPIEAAVETEGCQIAVLDPQGDNSQAVRRAITAED